MDQALQEAKRRAQLSPDDSPTLWNYIRLLERRGPHIDESPLYAILTDGETIGSPCKFSSGTAVPYKEGDDKVTLFGRWMDDYTNENPEEYYPDIDRAWIVTEAILKAGDRIWNDADGGSDSLSDAVTSAVLSFYKNNAVKTITFPPTTEDDFDDGDPENGFSEELFDKVYTAYDAYRKSKDGGRVRASVRWNKATLDLLVGLWLGPRQVGSGGKIEQHPQLLPHPPHELLVKKLDQVASFKAILCKEDNTNYVDGCGYHLLCEACERISPFRCTKMPNAEFAHLTHHKLDDHVILEVDGKAIIDEDELLDCL